MKLLREISEDVKVDMLVESTEGSPKVYYITGIFMQANVKNRNGRVYPVDVLDREVDRYVEQYVKRNRAVGELDHPEGPSINYRNAAIKIESLVREGSNFMGRAKILSTPQGETAKRLIDDGVILGVSSRGLGVTKKQDGVDVVQSSFYLATAADIVADPSAPEALMTAIVEEREWVLSGGTWVPKFIDGTRQALRTYPRGESSKVLSKIFEDYMKNLSKNSAF